MNRLVHAPLPDGLSAFVSRADVGLTVTVSQSVPAGEQHAAVRTALQAARRAWSRQRTPAFPSGPYLSRASCGPVFYRLGRVQHLLGAAGVTAAVATFGAVMVLAPPQQPVLPGAGSQLPAVVAPFSGAAPGVRGRQAEASAPPAPAAGP